MEAYDASSYVYPMNTLGHTSTGYYNNLTDDQASMLHLFQRYIVDNKIDMSSLARYSIHPQLTLLRFLRANGFDYDKTVMHVLTCLQWRVDNQVDALMKLTPEEILGCSMNTLTDVYPHWHSGYDKTGRPVLYKQYAKFDVAAISKFTTYDNVCRYHIWEQETCLNVCLQQSLKTNKIVETLTVVIDVKDMKLSQVTREFLSVIKRIAQIDQEQYPETLGQLYIINVPSVFPYVWRVIKPFLDSNVVAKIKIFSSNKDWQPVFYEHIGQDNLPATYGGNLPALSSSIYPYTITLASTSASYDSATAADSNQDNIDGTVEQEMTTEIIIDAVEGSSSHVSSRVHTSSNSNRQNLSIRIDSNNSSTQAAMRGVFRNWEEELQFLYRLEDGMHSKQSHAVSPNGTTMRYNSIANTASTIATHIIPTEAPLIGCCVNYMLSRLRKTSIQSLRKILLLSVIASTSISILFIIASAYLLSVVNWSDTVAKAQLWTGVVILFICVSVVLSNGVGLLAYSYMNRQLLLVYGYYQSFCSLCFLLVSLAFFSYSYIQASQHIPIEQIDYTQQKFLRFYHITLGVCSVFGSILTTIPATSSFIISNRVRLMYPQSLSSDWRVVMKVLQSMLTVFSVVMLSYGAVSLVYLFKQGLQSLFNYVYACIYCGMTVLLVSIFGFWVANTGQVDVIKVYYMLLLPVTLLLLSAGAASTLGAISLITKGRVSLAEVPTARQLLALETQLIVVGTFCCFIGLFLLLSLYASRSLARILTFEYTKIELEETIPYLSLDDLNRGRVASESTNRRYNKRQWRVVECVNIVWSISIGLLYIYLVGSACIIQATNKKLEVSIDLPGAMSSNIFVVLSAISALVVGPLLLLYAWACYELVSYRHIVGIIAFTIQMIIQIIVYGTIRQSIFHHIDHYYSLYVTFLLVSTFVQIVLPAVQLSYELKAVILASLHYDSYITANTIDQNKRAALLQYEQKIDSHVNGRSNSIVKGSDDNTRSITTSVLSSIYTLVASAVMSESQLDELQHSNNGVRPRSKGTISRSRSVSIGSEITLPSIGYNRYRQSTISSGGVNDMDTASSVLPIGVYLSLQSKKAKAHSSSSSSSSSSGGVSGSTSNAKRS